MKTYSVDCTYGSNKIPDTCYVYEARDGGKWYAVDGSNGVNFTYDEITDGVDVEELNDIDYFTSGTTITSEEDLESAVES